MDRPFDIDQALDLVGEVIRSYPKAAMFELRDRGFGTVFQQLCACVLSIRTRDEVSLLDSLSLLRAAPDPESLLKLSDEELLALVPHTSFPRDKIATLRAIAREAAEVHGGELPATPEALTAIRGVGPKCAHLALGVAANLPVIAVDIHVHRVTNRWGYVTSKTPEETLAQLETKLPERWRVEINARLVPFGKHVCQGASPLCSTCPVRPMCPRIGVARWR